MLRLLSRPHLRLRLLPPSNNLSTGWNSFVHNGRTWRIRRKPWPSCSVMPCRSRRSALTSLGSRAPLRPRGRKVQSLSPLTRPSSDFEPVEPPIALPSGTLPDGETTKTSRLHPVSRRSTITFRGPPMHHLLPVMLQVLLAPLSTADEKFELKSKEGRFTVSLPAKPMETTQDVFLKDLD